MLKKVIGTFKIYPCSDYNDIYHYLTIIDGRAFYGEPYASGGIRNKYSWSDSVMHKQQETKI